MAQYNEVETISRQLDSLDTRLKALETSGRLFASGIGAGGINVYNQGALRVEDGGSINIYDGGNLEIYGETSDPSTITVGSGGTVVADGPVSFAKSSTFGGDVNISGNLTVTGNLNIRQGIIRTNALKNQMSGARSSNSASNFSLSTSFADRTSTSITAPSWASTAVVYLSGFLQYELPADEEDLVLAYARARIQSSYSQGYFVSPFGTNFGIFGVSYGFTEVVNNPGTITGAIQARSTKSLGSTSFNRANINLYAIFYR